MEVFVWVRGYEASMPVDEPLAFLTQHAPDGVAAAFQGWSDEGVGLVLAVTDEGRRLQVRFAGRPGMTIVSGRDPALAAVSADGQIRQKLSAVNGDAREPAWGPNR